MAKLAAAHKRRAIRVGGELRYHHDAPFRCVEPPPLPGKIYKAGEILTAARSYMEYCRPVDTPHCIALVVGRREELT